MHEGDKFDLTIPVEPFSELRLVNPSLGMGSDHTLVQGVRIGNTRLVTKYLSTGDGVDEEEILVAQHEFIKRTPSEQAEYLAAENIEEQTEGCEGLLEDLDMRSTGTKFRERLAAAATGSIALKYGGDILSNAIHHRHFGFWYNLFTGGTVVAMGILTATGTPTTIKSIEKTKGKLRDFGHESQELGRVGLFQESLLEREHDQENSSV